MSLLGIDVGTTGTKAIVFRAEDGALLGSGYREYPLLTPRPGWLELDPNLVWARVREAVREAVSQAGPRDPVQSLAVSAQGEAVVPLSPDGGVLANSPVTFDNRTVGQADGLIGKVGRERLFEITGMPPHPMYTICKLMWWGDEAAFFNSAWKFLCYQDFITYRLGARDPAIDHSLAGRTMALDLASGTWSAEILAAAGVDPAKLAKPVAPGTAVGTIDSRIAAELGLPADVILVAGAHDQAAGTLGAGITQGGVAMNATGTVDVIGPVFDAPVLTPAMLASNYCCYRHAVPGLYLSIAFNFTGGSLLRWYRDTLGRQDIDEASAAGLDVYDVMLANATPSDGPSPVLCLPHFTVTGTPWFDPRARGALVGLTLSTTRGEIIAALVDGITYEMRLNLEKLAEAGVAIQALRAIGGGARSTVWLQRKADIFGRPVQSLNISEAACLGAAILAGVGRGVYPSAAEAAGGLVRVKKTYDPRPEAAARFTERYALYRELYPTLKALAHRL